MKSSLVLAIFCGLAVVACVGATSYAEEEPKSAEKTEQPRPNRATPRHYRHRMAPPQMALSRFLPPAPLFMIQPVPESVLFGGQEEFLAEENKENENGQESEHRGNITRKTKHAESGWSYGGWPHYGDWEHVHTHMGPVYVSPVVSSGYGYGDGFDEIHDNDHHHGHHGYHHHGHHYDHHGDHYGHHGHHGHHGHDHFGHHGHDHFGWAGEAGYAGGHHHHHHW